jgi:hypothetical protein
VSSSSSTTLLSFPGADNWHEMSVDGGKKKKKKKKNNKIGRKKVKTLKARGIPEMEWVLRSGNSSKKEI